MQIVNEAELSKKITPHSEFIKNVTLESQKKNKSLKIKNNLKFCDKNFHMISLHIKTFTEL